ncbi:MAG: PorP/SprF family type IX secretion system membrane protein [Bacteroidota bacterium]
MKRMITLTFLAFSFMGLAQDGHFTQFYNAPMFMNPALTGLRQDQVRLTNNYRSQWNGITAYRTMQFGLDKWNNKWGYGLNWNKNSAGKGTIQTNNLHLGVARHVETGQNSYLSLGFQGGLFQRSFDMVNATFETQFNGSANELLTSSGEDFSFEQVSLFDLNAGFTYSQQTDDVLLELGGAIQHIFGGNESVYENTEQLLPRKMTLHASAGMAVDSALMLIPGVMYQSQGTAQALNISILARKKFQQDKYVELGIGTRVKDAFMFYGGVDLQNIKFGVSYDANSSILRSASRGFGAIEFSLALRLGDISPKKKEQPNPRKLDSDDDGVADDMDRCPDVPGDPKNLGCPGKIDSDGDGLTDDVDLCPFIYGLAIQSGCPDTDGDGIADIDDACPTVYGALNLMGCPDSDRDGVSDKEDACPTIFGLVQLKGCPDSKMGTVQYTTPGTYTMTPNLNVPAPMTYVPAPLVQQQPQANLMYTNPQHNVYQSYTDGYQGYARTYPYNQGVRDYSTAMVLDNFFVLFEKDSWELSYEAKKQLRDYVIALGMNKEYKLLISGHTDQDGTPGYNIELGQKRAEAVASYLYEFGLEQGRIITISYGEHKPYSSSYTMESMARNRRVEVMLIK